MVWYSFARRIIRPFGTSYSNVCSQSRGVLSTKTWLIFDEPTDPGLTWV